MSDNYIASFKGSTGLPGNPMVQPLLKHLENNKEWSVIQLATILIEEKRIEEDSSLDLIEMMTKIAFNDVLACLPRSDSEPSSLTASLPVWTTSARRTSLAS